MYVELGRRSPIDVHNTHEQRSACQNSGPLLFVETWISDSLHGDGSKHINAESERNSRERRIQSKFFYALHGLMDGSWITVCIHVVFDECAHDVHGEASLRGADGVALGRKSIEVAQAALEHIERMQHIDGEPVPGGFAKRV